MEGKIKKLLLVTGSVMSATVALLPLTSYASTTQPVTGPVPGISEQGYAHGYACDDSQAGNKCVNDQGTTTYTVNVAPILSIDAASGGDVIHVEPNLARTGTLSADVRSAKEYTISLSAEVPYLTNVEDDTFSIPSRSEIAPGKTAWGIKKYGENTYTAITQTPQVFFTGGPHDTTTTTEFEIGVSVSDRLPQGTYATDVTITAAIKE